MTLHYTNPSPYLTDKKPPALIIEAPRETNPWINLLANPKLASFSANATLSSVTTSGTAQNQITYSFPVITDYSFVEQVENFRELDFGQTDPQMYVKPIVPRELPKQINYVAWKSDIKIILK